jgi:hypothetical protein
MQHQCLCRVFCGWVVCSRGVVVLAGGYAYCMHPCITPPPHLLISSPPCAACHAVAAVLVCDGHMPLCALPLSTLLQAVHESCKDWLLTGRNSA